MYRWDVFREQFRILISGFAMAAFTLACTKDGVVVKIRLQPEPMASSRMASMFSKVAFS